MFVFAFEMIMCEAMLHATDMGGSMVVHTFGAYFGIGAAITVTNKKLVKKAGQADLEEGNYDSQLIAMIGTIFLWCFWPSFNGALAGGNA